MVEVNHGRRELGDVITLDQIPRLSEWELNGGVLRLGSGLTYKALAEPLLAELVPSLAQAARTVGSPQIRNAGTLGGNLATASPAGDTIPVLAALDAIVELRSANGHREVSVTDFITGVKRNNLQSGELIEAIRVGVADGPHSREIADGPWRRHRSSALREVGGGPHGLKHPRGGHGQGGVPLCKRNRDFSPGFFTTSFRFRPYAAIPF